MQVKLYLVSKKWFKSIKLLLEHGNTCNNLPKYRKKFTKYCKHNPLRSQNSDFIISTLQKCNNFYYYYFFYRCLISFGFFWKFKNLYYIIIAFSVYNDLLKPLWIYQNWFIPHTDLMEQEKHSVIMLFVEKSVLLNSTYLFRSIFLLSHRSYHSLSTNCFDYGWTILISKKLQLSF